jgi:AcrR family transcriptional regulator
MRAMKAVLDTRAERSRSALLTAFVQLIFRDGFESLTVQAIVSEAGISRSTFYEHFSCKDDILRASMGHLFAVVADCIIEERPPLALTKVMAHFWENRRLADRTFSGSARVILARSLSEMIEARLHTSNGGRPLLLPYRLAAIQIAEAQFALIENWLRGRAFADAETVATALHHSSRVLALAFARR